MHEGTSSPAGIDSRCRHIMGDMERKAKMLWDSPGLAGRLSEQGPPGEGCVCFLSAGFSVGSPARWSAMEGRWGWEVDHRERETGSGGKSGSR